MRPDWKCLLILSGGQDSTTAGFWAKETQKFTEIHAITFNYGQRHQVEIEAAKKIAEALGVATHEIIDIGPVLTGTSPLVNKNESVGHYPSTDALPGGVEPTFVPARNMLFLTIAANRAAALGINHLVTGVCQTDFGGYYDCRRSFINAAEIALSEALYGKRQGLTIWTPLMDLTKAQTVNLAFGLKGCFEALAYTHTCYDGEYPPNPHNHASLLRARGFHEAGKPDPLILRAKSEKLLPDDYPDDGLVEGTEYAYPWQPSDMHKPAKKEAKKKSPSAEPRETIVQDEASS